MMVYDASEYVAAWVAAKLGHRFGICTAIGVAEGQRLIAGVVYHEYREVPKTMQMSVYAERGSNWLSRAALEQFFGYPFLHLACNAVYITVRRSNKHAKRFVHRIGFKPAGLLRRGFGTEDAVLYDMLPTECKWLHRSGHGQVSRISASGS